MTSHGSGQVARAAVVLLTLALLLCMALPLALMGEDMGMGMTVLIGCLLVVALFGGVRLLRPSTSVLSGWTRVFPEPTARQHVSHPPRPPDLVTLRVLLI